MSRTGFVLFIAFFVTMWLCISFLAAAIGGWRELAKHYRTSDRPLGGQRFFMRSAGMRFGTGYRGAMNLAVDSGGLYLSVVPPFNFGHPRLFVPWSEVSVRRRRWWFIDSVEFDFAQSPDVPLIVPRRLGEALLNAGPVRLPAV